MSFRAGVVVSLGLFALVAGGGCGNRVCDCSGAGAVIQQTALAASIVSLTADSPCTVKEYPFGDGGAELVVSVETLAPGSCQIRETLADGSTWVATLSWAVGGSSPLECCANSPHDVGPAPTFTRTDAGTP